MKIWLFVLLKLRILRNSIRTIHKHSRLKLAVVSLFAVTFWLGLFMIFYKGFWFISTRIHHHFVAYVMDYLFSVFYLTLFLMLIFSTAIIALTSLFRCTESRFLMSCPVPFEDLFSYKFLEATAFSSWAVLFLGLPLGLAYAAHLGVEILYYPLLIMLFIPYIIIPAILGTLITFLITLYIQRWKKILLVSIILTAFAGLFLFIYSLVMFKSQDSQSTAEWFNEMLRWLGFSSSPFLPSTWMSKGMTAAAQGDYEEVIFNLLLLVSNAFFLFMISYILAQKRYSHAWSIASSAKGENGYIPLNWVKHCFFFLKPHTRIFLEKDIKSFLRDPVQWSQFLILIGLLCFYILNLRTLEYDERHIFWKNIIANLNLMATSLTVCTFASRFIFPLLSLEGKRFWVLGVIPFSRRSILLGKFIFAMITLTLISQVLIILSCIMLRLPMSMTILHSLTMFLISSGISGLSVGLGALYPDFHEDSPSKIISGFGGTFNLVIGLIFVIIIISLQTLPAYYLLSTGKITTFFLIPLFVVIIISLATCLIPLLLGIRNFNKIEM